MTIPDPLALAAPLVAFSFGLVTGVHCMGMCGPLACFFLHGRKPTELSWWRETGVYHGMRILGYTLIGAVLGGLGAAAAGIMGPVPAKILSFLCAAIFLCIAFRMDRWMPKKFFPTALLGRLKLDAQRPTLSAFLIGMVTPIIPCGPLYTVAGVALVSGSVAGGASIMASFAAGTVALLLALQFNYAWIQRMVPVWLMSWLKQGVALLTAFLLIWRAVGVEEFHPAGPQETPKEHACPMCK